MAEIIMVPGIGGSGELHWQTRWEEANPRWHRLRPTDWNKPELDDWVLALDRAVGAAEGSPLLVAHSLGCLLVAHWQQVSTAPVAGAFLVAVPDPASPAFPVEAASFVNPPRTKFRFPSLIIASANDPYGSVEYARERASQWGCGIAELGELGHINETSKLEDWLQGKALLAAFAAGTAN